VFWAGQADGDARRRASNAHGCAGGSRRRADLVGQAVGKRSGYCSANEAKNLLIDDFAVDRVLEMAARSAAGGVRARA